MANPVARSIRRIEGTIELVQQARIELQQDIRISRAGLAAVFLAHLKSIEHLVIWPGNGHRDAIGAPIPPLVIIDGGIDPEAVKEARRNPGPPDGRGDVPEGGQGEDPRGPRGERDAAGGVREVEARVALGLDAPPLGEAGGGGPAGGPAARGEGPGGGAAQARALPGGDGGGGREARLGRGAPRGRRPQARRLVRRAGAVVVQEGRRGG